jgi:hypothetical protein
MKRRSEVLAARIEEGAATLADFASALTDAEWRTTTRDGRSIGVTVHHVASMYPIEVDVISKVVRGESVAGVTWEAVAHINAEHAQKNASVSRKDALDLLKKNAKSAADAVRKFSDDELDRFTSFPLAYDAPVTVQFIIEDHPLRHPWHHIARMQAALGKSPTRG